MKIDTTKHGVDFSMKNVFFYKPEQSQTIIKHWLSKIKIKYKMTKKKSQGSNIF